MKKIIMILNIFFLSGFVLTLPELVNAIADSEYLALNILFAIGFIGITYFDLPIIKNNKKWGENGNRNKS